MADNSNDQNQKRPDEELNILMAEWKEKYGLPPEEERQNFYRENPVTSAGILAGFGWAIWRVKNMNKNVGTSQGGRGVNLGSMRTYYLLETRVFAQMGIVAALVGTVLYQGFQTHWKPWLLEKGYIQSDTTPNPK